MLRTPAPGELLDALDAGASLPPLERASTLLRAMGELAADDLDALSMGERDRLLIQLREQLFGTTLRSVVECPTCGVPLELVLATEVLLQAAPARARGEVEVEVDGCRVRARPLRPSDLADAAATGSTKAARALLVERSVLSAELDGGPVPAAYLSARVVAAVADALADVDPLADVQLPIVCDACGATWTGRLDFGDYLWRELDAWAARLLGEVHALAGRYGWSEDEILSLTPRRRRAYVDLVGHA